MKKLFYMLASVFLLFLFGYNAELAAWYEETVLSKLKK